MGWGRDMMGVGSGGMGKRYDCELVVVGLGRGTIVNGMGKRYDGSW